MIDDPTPALHMQLWPLSYEKQLEPRSTEQIDLVVIHCTELPDLAMAREYGERRHHENGTGNSGHFYIDRDGSAYQFVAAAWVAHHTRGYNPRSIGIEIVNRGRYPHWLDADHQAMTEPYTFAQIISLNALLRRMKTEFNNLRYIAGHEDLDKTLVPATDDPSQQVCRKRDPGVQFPWAEVLRESGLERLLP